MFNIKIAKLEEELQRIQENDLNSFQILNEEVTKLAEDIEQEKLEREVSKFLVHHLPKFSAHGK